MNDLCPCGAPLTLDPINLSQVGFSAHCQAGHRVFLADLEGPGVILDDIDHGGRL